MTEEGDVEAFGEVLADGTSRAILVEARGEPLSASELADRCNVSGPTVYRRLERLQEQDLVETRTRLDPDGHHQEVHVATLDRAVVDLLDEGFDLDVSRRESMADRFTRLIKEI